MDKYGAIDEMLKKMDVLADAKGAVRCGLIWDVSLTLKSLKEWLEKEDAAHRQTLETLKAESARGGGEGT